MVLLAPAKSMPASTNQQLREVLVQASEKAVAEGSASKEAKSPSQINHKEVADKIYHLMQHDLILERERATNLGG